MSSVIDNFNGRNETTGKPISSKTVVHHLIFISDVFNYAIRMDMLTDNPCRRVIPPKAKTAERAYYTLEEVEKLFELLRGEPLKYQGFFNLAIYSGFRRSEMLGLEWHDINFETGVIHIQRTSNYTKAKGIYTDDTKTKGSNRYVKIPQDILDLLSAYRKVQANEFFEIGDKYVETDRLFTKWNGLPMNPQTPYGWLKEFCEKNDMPFYGIHSSRHFAASALISSGLDVVTVSGALGHCNSGTTLNIYSHMFQTAQARVAQAMDGAFSFLPQDSTT